MLAFFARKTHTSHPRHPTRHVLMWVCFVFIYGLSLYWFWLITRSLYKALRGDFAAPKEGEEKKKN